MMNNTYDELYKNICRVCLTQSVNMIGLTDDASENGLNCYGKSIAALTNISLRIDDNLPSQMCLNCVSLLKQAITFKLKCEMSDSKLKTLLGEIKKIGCSEQDIKECVCQYIMYNSYFPPTIDQEAGQSHHKAHVMKCQDNLYFSDSITPELRSETFDSNAVDYDEYSDTDQKAYNIDANPDSTNGVEDNIDLVLDTIHQMINADSIIVKKKRCKPKTKHCKSDNSSDLDETDIKITKPKPKNVLELNNKKKMMKMKSKQKLFCKICNKIFAYRSSHRLHMRRHENGENLEGRPRICKKKSNQRYVCKICNKKLASCASYIVHMRRHNNFPYICDQCGKGFAVPNEMRMHQVSKHGIGPCLQCDYCSYKTTIKSYLVEHVRIHTGERPFTCEHCGLTFRRRAIWKKHLVRHMEKKFQCTYCPLKFYSNFQLSEHCNSVHFRKYMYTCSICSAMYIQTKMVRRHMIVEHGIPKEEQGKIAKVNVENDK